jgi:TolB protein
MAAAVTLTLVGGCAQAPTEVEAWLVFGSGRSGEGDIHAMPLAGGDAVPVLRDARPEGGPRWDAAGRRVVFQRFTADERAVLVAVDSVGARELFDDPSGDASPIWSPDGRWLAFTKWVDGREELHVAPATGGPPRVLTNDSVPDRHPTWSPDGERLAWVRGSTGGWRIVEARWSDGVLGAPVEIGEARSYLGHLAWSPDGSAIAFDTRFDDDVEIAVLERATGRVRRVTRRPGNDLAPAWSPDGTVLAFGGEVDGDWEVWTVAASGGEAVRRTESPGFDGAPVIVPWVPPLDLGAHSAPTPPPDS